MVQWCSGAVVQWCSGSVVQWFSGSVVQWFSGSVVQWFSGAVVQWCSGAVVQWFSGSVVQWFSGSVVQWFSGSVVQWFSGSVVQWFSGSVVQWFSGSVVQWFSGAVVQWFSGSVVQWFSGSVVQWFSGSVVQWFCGPSKPVIKSIPNLLSLTRLALAPYLFWALWRGHFDAALVTILVAGITDGLDGYLARHLKVSSQTGEVLDPIADKVLLSCAFVALWLNGSVEGWLASIVLGRDALILIAAGIALLVSKARKRFPPSVWGKLSTIVQISLVVTMAARLPSPIPDIVKWTTAALTVISFVHYAWLFLRESYTRS